jgi:enoyl-CoA hydratase/carnithine racemase
VPELDADVDLGVGRLVINRPDFHNALTRRMWEELPRALAGLGDAGAKVVVISGRGQSFASGADLFELEALTTYESARDHWCAIRDSLSFLRRFQLPTVAMISGPCLGGGCLIALACDLRFASLNAVFAVPVSRLGIILDDENVGSLASVVGPAFAKEMLFSGATISATRAAEIGLINQALAADRLQSATEEIVGQIACNSQQSIIEAKRSIARWLDYAAGDGQDEQAVVNSYLSAEFRSRVARARQL